MEWRGLRFRLTRRRNMHRSIQLIILIFEMRIYLVSEEAHIMDHIHIDLVVSNIKLEHRFLSSENTKVLKYSNYDDNIR
ncbi:unnamed protein product [Lupinus luteus]|uniref:Uncharacterized protein n=1 Tax=Lupinus luteus TaxID=3873 RepID=A0AAV1W206_LUPLU